MTGKAAGQEFEEFMEEALKDEEVRAYLESFSVAVGDLVLARRTELQLSQRALAEKAGTTQARISQIEAGFGGVKMDTLNRVFAALELKEIRTLYHGETSATVSA